MKEKQLDKKKLANIDPVKHDEFIEILRQMVELQEKANALSIELFGITYDLIVERKIV